MSFFAGWKNATNECRESMQTEHPCRTHHCENGGTCIERNSYEYYCNCPPNFNGLVCQFQVTTTTTRTTTITTTITTTVLNEVWETDPDYGLVLNFEFKF